AGVDHHIRQPFVNRRSRIQNRGDLFDGPSRSERGPDQTAPFIHVKPPRELVRKRSQPDDVTELTYPLTISLPQHRSAPGGDDGLGKPVEKLGQSPLLPIAKLELSGFGENHFDRTARTRLDLAIDVDECPIHCKSKQTADGRLARSSIAD